MGHAVFDAVRALLAGEEIDVDSPELSARSAWLSEPRPVQEQIPLTIGTANSVLLRWAGAHADVVGIAGFGRTLPDGHMHEVRWRAHELEQQLGHVAAGAAGRTDSPPLEALVQQVVVTHDARAAIAATASRLGLTEAAYSPRRSSSPGPLTKSCRRWRSTNGGGASPGTSSVRPRSTRWPRFCPELREI
jgi:alkanesulfonate monooxygenase SsuD/methylene tetrahydromethanopterin reductase-like flavin-dependent oxidoreductase (luciferase family)